jgi:hypothetical protein
MHFGGDWHVVSVFGVEMAEVDILELPAIREAQRQAAQPPIAAISGHASSRLVAERHAPSAFPTLERHAAKGGDKPVPEAKLKAWFEAWKSLYPPELQTNDTGLEHARLTFPKNKVTRDRIRLLRDAKTPGRKRSAELRVDSAE